MNKNRKETLEKQLNLYVVFMIIAGISCIVGSIFEAFNNYTDYQNNIIEYGVMIQLLIKEIMIFFIGVTSIIITRNIKLNRLFISSTANLISILGLIIILGSIIQSVARNIWYAPYTDHIIENSLGRILITISQIFRIGIKIREENDLTI